MASPVLPSNSNFLGVALVVNRSRDGPQFVFHYPPHILPTDNAPRRRATAGDNANGQVSDDDDDEEEDGDDILDEEDEDVGKKMGDDDALLNPLHYSLAGTRAGGAPRDSVDPQTWNHDEHLETETGSHIVPWDHVAGFPTKDLESLLTPARPFHKKRFQISLDQLFFASYPVFVPENGMWRKTRKRRQQQQQQQQEQQVKAQPTKSPENDDTENRSDHAPALQDTPQIEGNVSVGDGTCVNQPDEAEEKKSGMTMFNLVFILNPKRHEARELIDTLYFHIIKKVNKVYKYSQQRCDFVWKESKRILAMKDKGREARTNMGTLWREILDASTLAASMQDIYEAVSRNKIAALQLDTAEGTVTHSVQVPAPFCLTDLPADDEPGSKGLWITTAHNFIVEDADDRSFMDKNFALLLLSDEKKIVAELQADADDTTAAMVEFVRLSRPTLSFHQIGHGNALSPAQVRKYAQHFIFWRRAIAIPPLHARDVYIMSPNCNVDELPGASQAWAKTFPLAPPLPNFLADLSTAPRPYKWFCPSKNHRPAYLAMLAWLMRGGWVTQLCTFAYVVVWPEILYEVEYQLEADELRGQSASSSLSNTTALPPTASNDPEPTSGGGDASHHADPSSPKRLSPAASARSPTTSSPDHGSSPPSDSQNATIGEQVAEKARLERIADKANREAAEKAAMHARRHPPVATDHPSTNDASHLAHLSPHVIIDAKKATGKDSLYLSAIGRRFCGEDSNNSNNHKVSAGTGNNNYGGAGGGSRPHHVQNVQKAWPVFWKYFDGRSALERVALQEDMKRKEAWNLLTAMSEHLLCVRHW